MKLQVSRAGFISIILLVASILSLTYTTVAAYNYRSYWDARSELTSTVNKLQIQTSSTNGIVTISATVSAMNPTDYSGMTVYDFELKLFFVKPALNQSLFSDLIIDLTSKPANSLGDPVGPRGSVTSIMTVQLSASRSAALISFIQPTTAQVYGQTTLIAHVDSFLDPVVGTQDVPSYQTISIS